jgi:hypothetical protein
VIESATQLFGALWGTMEGWGEIRMLKPDHAPKPYFFPLPLTPKFQYVAFDWMRTQNQQGYDAFFGVHPRNDKRGKNVNVPQYVAAIADLDDPVSSWPAVAKLADHGAPPSACIRTARGVHLYWLLAEPEAAIHKNQEIIQRLQMGLGSDAVHDPARVLRVPGTLYWKFHPQFSKVYTAWLDTHRRYTLNELSGHVQALWPDLEVQPEPTVAHALEAVGGPARPIRDDLWAKFVAPIPKGFRSEVCLSFIQTALLYGWDDEMIANTLLTLPIGGHYTGRGGGALEFDIDKARKNLASRVGEVCRVQIQRVSVVQNPDGACGGNNFKVRVTFWVKSGAQMTSFDEWIIVPRMPNERLLARWHAFTEATRYNGSPFDSIALTALIGRELRVEVKNTGTRPRAIQFLPL